MFLKTIQINNRRYLGNKYKLLPFIRAVVDSECRDVSCVADIFAGTGAVASAFTDRQLITNDILYSNYLCHLAWFSPQKFSTNKLRDLITHYNEIVPHNENYMSETFSNTYFSKEDCRKIGFIREDIEELFLHTKINARERALLITALLYAADRIANTCGHYDAFRKNVAFDRHLELALPLPVNNLNCGNLCYNENAETLVTHIYADLIYLDPPYNSRQYCDSYHLLENVARWEKPIVYGIARKMNRDKLKSEWCGKGATAALEQTVANINAHYILLSYNNMEHKGDDRSNAKITDEDIMRILSTKGRVQTFSQRYKAFSAGKSDISGNEERLFLCDCKEKSQPFIQSPMNYTGGKFKLLPQILPLFPKNIDCFVDLFCGGCNVGINVSAKKIILNDINQRLIRMYQSFVDPNNSNFIQLIDNIISNFNLSQSNVNGYEYYGCNSSSGLATYNKDGFLRLRSAFNNKKERDVTYYAMMFSLIIFGFNNQIRFNSKGEYNLPVGKRDFNSKLRTKMCEFIEKLNQRMFTFRIGSFHDFDTSLLSSSSMVYCDPPYLITCAGYNENGGWTIYDDADLLKFLDRLNALNIRFALSNVLQSKGRQNLHLIQWAKQYHTIHLDSSYANCNYHTKNRSQSTDEVLIINY